MSQVHDSLPQFWFIAGALFILGNLFNGVFKRRSSARILEKRPQFNKSALRGLAREFGTNSNSFLTLYPGFQYFCSENSKVEGAIAFLDKAHAWVAATEPMGNEHNAKLLLQEFAAAAKNCRKSAIFIPVSRKFSDLALEYGYTRLMVGSEPVFDLRIYDPSVETQPLAKQIRSRGAKVAEFTPKDLTPEEWAEYDDLIDEWLETRRMTPLSFLNKVAPWEHASDKKYFRVKQDGQILAFVAAIPIWGRNGWYLIDLLRRSDAPIGATELLVLESMNLLKAQGAHEVTLGVSPLALLENAPGDKSHRLLYRLLRLVYERGGLLYRFKPLFTFKMKFSPTRWDPAFMIVSPPRLGLFSTLSLLEAFIPGGIVKATTSGARRLFSRLDFGQSLEQQTSLDVVMRPLPSNFLGLVQACKFSIALFLLNILAYGLTVGTSGGLAEEWLNYAGFSWQSLVDLRWEALLLPGLLHNDALHLDSNLAFLMLFCGLLECLGGSVLALICYLAGSLLSNPIAGVGLFGIYRVIRPEMWGDVSEIIDVGASLGIFACAGALAYFLRYGKSFAAILIGGSILYSALTANPLMLNHVVAVLIGLTLGRVYLGRRAAW